MDNKKEKAVDFILLNSKYNVMENKLPVKKDIPLSNATKDRVEACKIYIERKYAKQLKEE